MKKSIVFSVFLFFVVSLVAQTETVRYKDVADTVEKLYNTNKYDSIFSLFSTEMKQALPLDKTIVFFQGVKHQAGEITGREFVQYERGTYASYKTNFERLTMLLNISLDNSDRINGLFIRPYIDNIIPVIERNVTKLILPFYDEWFTVWGGDTKELNYHIENRAQKNAFDFIIKDSTGKSYKTDGLSNEDYYAFGKELVAPCAGEVVTVVDGVYDNKPGELNPYYVPGNTVILKTKNDEYIFLAHFRQHSIVVREGQTVKQGDLLGLCGNSGNSTEPHLHFHLQNTDKMTMATGIKCYFDSIIINGDFKTDYSPLRAEKVKNK